MGMTSVLLIFYMFTFQKRPLNTIKPPLQEGRILRIEEVLTQRENKTKQNGKDKFECGVMVKVRQHWL